MPISTRTPEQIALLQRTVAQIEAHPEDWEQEHWRCETGMCFAGWAVTLAGRQWAFPSSTADAMFLVAEDGEQFAFPPEDDEPPVVYCADVARRTLGLSQEDSDLLFYGGNSLRTIKAYVANLIAGRDVEDDQGFEETRDE
jgi:hypothetical protein